MIDSFHRYWWSKNTDHSVRSAFPRIQPEYGEILCISPYSVQMQKDKDQNNSKYKHFLRSGCI